MTLSGALADDKQLFESGLIAVHSRDNNGRTVLFVDRIRAIPPLATRDATVSEFGCVRFNATGILRIKCLTSDSLNSTAPLSIFHDTCIGIRRRIFQK